jgi:hypothetical protein
MKTQIIQLDSHDDLISARDKIAWSKAPRILLVWPRKGRVLERQLDLLELQRYAQAMGSQVGVVTRSGEVRTFARDLGIPIFSSADQAQRKSWRRTRGRKRLDRGIFARKVDVARLREQRANFKVSAKENVWVRISAFVSGVLAIFALLFFFLPSARMELTPQRDDQQLQLDMRANLSIASANPAGGMPAYPVSVIVEGSDQLPSSGSTAVPDAPAIGQVEFGNLTDTEISIPAGTIIATLDNPPRRYEVRQDGKLLAGVGKKVSLPVRALIPGSKGNVPAGSLRAIEGAVGLQAEVNNPGSMYGGTDRISPAPTENDYAMLRARLVESLQGTAQMDMLGEMTRDQRFLDGTIKIVEVQKQVADPQPMQPGDYARLNLKIEFEGWYVLEADLLAIARTALEANLRPGFVPLNAAINVEFGGPVEMGEDGTASWKATVGRQLEADWDNLTAARMVVGMQPDQAAKKLEGSLSLARPARVVLNPDWWIRMPFLSFRIAVVRQ